MLPPTTAVSLIGAGPASAHARVVSSSPAEGANINSLSTARVTFNEAVTGSTTALRVVNAAGVAVSGAARVSGSSVSASVPSLAAGRYALVYRVTSADGHVIANALGFSVRRADPPAKPVSLRLSRDKVSMSGIRVGTRTVRLSGALRNAIGQVTWRLPGFPESFEWNLSRGKASGMLPFPGTYSVTITAFASASSTRTLTGTVRISP